MGEEFRPAEALITGSDRKLGSLFLAVKSDSVDRKDGARFRRKAGLNRTSVARLFRFTCVRG